MKEAVSLPVLAGFGISTPAQARQTLDAGADGVICGSAVVRRIEAHLDDPDAMIKAVGDFAAEMKAATRPGRR